MDEQEGQVQAHNGPGSRGRESAEKRQKACACTEFLGSFCAIGSCNNKLASLSIIVVCNAHGYKKNISNFQRGRRHQRGKLVPCGWCEPRFLDRETLHASGASRPH